MRSVLISSHNASQRRKLFCMSMQNTDAWEQRIVSYRGLKNLT